MPRTLEMTSVRMRTLAQLFILITITWPSLFRKQWLTYHQTYHYWVSHSSVLADFLPRSHSSLWENYGNYEKLARTEEGWCHAIHFRFCGSGLISSLFYCLLSPSPLSKPHQFLCKHNTHLLFWASQDRVNLTNGLKFPIKVAQSDLTWTGLTPL